MGKIFLCLGILCVVYYLGMIAYAGIRTSFSWFWLAMGAAFFGAAAVCIFPACQTVYRGIPRAVKLLAGTFLVIGIALFLFLEGCIISGMISSADQAVDYIIVLGAQVKGSTVSRPLKYRLDRAVLYLKEHDDTVVIVSGGQGTGEDISEAEAMARYLIEAGIQGERILREDQSVNTAQNILCSSKLIEESASVGIVSSDFHVFRAVHIAKAQGVEACGIPAPSSFGMYPHFMLREAFAIVKDLAFGNMVF